jgi:murein DD-endopeptidase MepM/ murein hydrolase activator NlpD
MPKTAGLVLVLLLASVAWADTPDDDWTVIEQRLSTRQQVLQVQKEQAELRAQEQALAAYRLQRRRELGFLASPDSRVQDAHASDLAIATLRRRHNERRSLSSELERVQADLRKLQQVREAQRDVTPSEDAGMRFVRPVKGVVVGEPGMRREPPTSTEIRRDGMEFLARLNEPVRAAGAGVVRIVESLPQGGYAVVIQHPLGWSSIISGMREVSVRPGEPVAQGQSVGLAGRNLDGAAVISLELWRNRKPVEPRGRLTILARPN